MKALASLRESHLLRMPGRGQLTIAVRTLLMLLVAGSADSQTLEIVLENPPIAPALGDYSYNASGASVACRGGWPSEAALIACEQQRAGSCGAPDFSPAGDWTDIAWKVGAATHGERRLSLIHI